jgi:hypothetical protein
MAILDDKASKNEAAVESASVLVGIQLDATETDLVKLYSADDFYALGYVFGFQDAVSKRFVGSDPMIVFVDTFLRLCGKQNVGKIAARCLSDLPSHPEFRKGMSLGSREAFAFIDSKTQPFGLAGHLGGQHKGTPMALLDKVKAIASAANDNARSVRLSKELVDTFKGLDAMSPERQQEVIARFIDKRTKLLQHMENWTKDGRLRMAKTLRDEARKQLDFNVPEGYALWLASAWLESGERESPIAKRVHQQLEELAPIGIEEVPVDDLLHMIFALTTTMLCARFNVSIDDPDPTTKLRACVGALPLKVQANIIAIVLGFAEGIAPIWGIDGDAQSRAIAVVDRMGISVSLANGCVNGLKLPEYEGTRYKQAAIEAVQDYIQDRSDAFPIRALGKLIR